MFKRVKGKVVEPGGGPSADQYEESGLKVGRLDEEEAAAEEGKEKQALEFEGAGVGEILGESFRGGCWEESSGMGRRVNFGNYPPFSLAMGRIAAIFRRLISPLKAGGSE